MIKLRKIFTHDVVPQLGVSMILEGDYDPATGLVYFGEDGVVHITMVRAATAARPIQTSTQPATPMPTVRKGPTKR